VSKQEKKESKCIHDRLEYLGDQRGERAVNKYYRCAKCGSVLICPRTALGMRCQRRSITNDVVVFFTCLSELGLHHELMVRL
jgi:hypothetical protein